MPVFTGQTGKFIVKKNQFRLIGLQSEASMSSYHQIQEENKVIAWTIRTELLVTNSELEIFSMLLKFTVKIFAAPEQLFPFCKYTAEANTISLVYRST